MKRSSFIQEQSSYDFDKFTYEQIHNSTILITYHLFWYYKVLHISLRD